MVPLRERKVQPSYSLLAEGLENITDSEDVAEDGEKIEEGVTKEVEASSAKGEDDDQSLSSGDSSQFQPEPVSPKEKISKKGERKIRDPNIDPALLSDNDDSISDGVDQNDKMDIDDRNDSDEELVSINQEKPDRSKRSGKSRIKPLRQNQPKIPPRPTGASIAAQQSFVQSEFNMMPLAYRNLIKESSAILAKSPAALKAPDDKSRDRDRSIYGPLEAFPSGPATPFSTRLKKKPMGRKPDEIEFIAEDEDHKIRMQIRRKEAHSMAGLIPLAAPWETWRGESWWPEMFREGPGETSVAGPSVSGGKGKGKAKTRSEVRLGFDDIGRLSLDEMELLSESDAAPFLPTLLDIHGYPRTTCHLGPYGSQTGIQFGMFSWRRIEDFSVNKEGFIFSAGGPVWGLDWCPYPEKQGADFEYTQYLALSTLPHIETYSSMGEKWPKSTPGGIQIWSMLPSASSEGDQASGSSNKDEKGTMQCEMVLCVDGGSAVEIKWMPLGAWDEYGIDKLDRKAIPKLGILATAQLDGSISFYSVPHPKILRRLLGSEYERDGRPLFLRLREPLLKLEIDDAMCTCFDWMTGTRLAVGLSNGQAAVWDVGDALRSGRKDGCLPSLYMNIALSYIRSVAAGRYPPGDAEGQPRFDEDPVYIVFGSYDGTAVLVDTRDSVFPMELNRSRVPTLAVAWSSQVVAPLCIDVDYSAIMVKLKAPGAGKSLALASHRGPVWDLATSDYHPMILSAGSDGTLKLSTAQTGFYKNRQRRPAKIITQTLYEMEYDIHTGEYRMVDNILPDVKALELITVRTAVKKKGDLVTEDPSLLKTANWPPQVGVHRATWNNGSGIGRAGMVLSGTGSGLARIDLVMGKFRYGVVPAK